MTLSEFLSEYDSARFLRPDDPVDYVRWAEKFYIFPKGDREPGRYRSERTPYVREILHELSPQSKTSKVIFIKPTQIGATTLSNILLSAIPHCNPAHCALIFPTDAMAQRHMKKKLSKAWAAIPELNGIINDRMRKDGNTMLYREFPGGSLVLAGCGAIDVQRSDSIQILLLTDVDSKEFVVQGEGDPIEVFVRRTDAYGSKKKIFIESTPLVKGVSIIEREYKHSSQGEYHVPCPHCGTFQFLEFGTKDLDYGFKFSCDDSGRPIDAWFVCQECKQRIDESHKFNMLNTGKYVHKYPDNPVKGFKINAFYSPSGFVSWLQMAEEWISSYKNHSKLQVFKNTRLAESFEMPGNVAIEWEMIKAKAENYPLFEVPPVGCVLSAGVDTHDNRLDVILMAFGAENASWVLWYGSIWGDPDGGESFDQLDIFLKRPYFDANGNQSFIRSCAIDIGGHRSDAIRNYTRSRYPVVIGVQGARVKTHPLLGPPNKIDLNYRGQRIEGGASVWNVGTHIAKDLIFARLQATDNSKIRTSKFLDDEFFKQITAEKLENRIDKYGRPVQDYANVRPGGANHALDCMVYAIAGISRTGISFDLFKGKNDNIAQQQKIIKPKEQPKKQFINKERRRIW